LGASVGHSGGSRAAAAVTVAGGCREEVVDDVVAMTQVCY